MFWGPPKAWHSNRNMTRPGLSDNLSKRQAERNPAITFTQFSIKSNIMFLIQICCIFSPSCFYCQGINKGDLLRGTLQGSVILFLCPQHGNGTALTWINPPACTCVLSERTSVVRGWHRNHRVQQQPWNKAQVALHCFSSTQAISPTEENHHFYEIALQRITQCWCTSWQK